MGLLSAIYRGVRGSRPVRAIEEGLFDRSFARQRLAGQSADNLTAGQRSAMEANGLNMYIPPGPQRERWAREPLSRGTSEMAANLAQQIETQAPDVAQALRSVKSDRELEEIMSAMAERGML